MTTRWKLYSRKQLGGPQWYLAYGDYTKLVRSRQNVVGIWSGIPILAETNTALPPTDPPRKRIPGFYPVARSWLLTYLNKCIIKITNTTHQNNKYICHTRICVPRWLNLLCDWLFDWFTVVNLCEYSRHNKYSWGLVLITCVGYT
jgi:hypothetical protein